VLLWEAACRVFHVPAFLVPAPSAIWVDTWKLAPQVWGHTLATTQTTLLGFFASLIVSLPLAILLTARRPLQHRLSHSGADSIHPEGRAGADPGGDLRSNELPRVVVTFWSRSFRWSCRSRRHRGRAAELIELGRACKASAGARCGASVCLMRCRSSSAA